MLKIYISHQKEEFVLLAQALPTETNVEGHAWEDFWTNIRPSFIDTVKKRNSRSCSNSDAGLSTNTQLDMTQVQTLAGRQVSNKCPEPLKYRNTPF